MTRILVLSIFSLVAISTVQSRTIAKYNEHPDMTEQNRINLEECAREYNVDVNALEDSIDFEEQLKNPTNVTCALICGLKKEWNIPDTPLYEIISNLVKTVYDDGFHSPRFSRKDAESKVKQCYIQEPNECEFIKCVGIAKPPLSEIIGYAVEKLAESIIEGIVKAIGDAISS